MSCFEDLHPPPCSTRRDCLLRCLGWLPLALLLLASNRSSAVLMVPVSIKELASKAEIVVHGSVLSKSCQRDSTGRIFTRVEIRVIDLWKGELSGNGLTIVHGGGILGEERAEVSGQVTYQPGEEVVAFLALNQRREAVTLGLAQGKFDVWTEMGIKYARNPFHGAPVIGRDRAVDRSNVERPPLTLDSLRQRVRESSR